MAGVNVDSCALTDARFSKLATLRGFADADHAIGKMVWLWLDCTLRGETDLPEWLVEQRLGSGGAEALIECELGSWSRGRGDSKTRRVYIHGANKRTTWYRRLTEQSSNGGKARAQNTTRVAGRFTSKTAGDGTSPLTSASASTSLEDRAKAIAEAAVNAINRMTGKSYKPDTEAVMRDCRKLARANITAAQAVAAVEAEGRPWLNDATFRDKVRPSTLLQVPRVQRKLDDLAAGNASTGQAAPRVPLSIPFDDGTKADPDDDGTGTAWRPS